jgi:hypothetical protein
LLVYVYVCVCECVYARLVWFLKTLVNKI